jgi:hypothetical protein
VLAFTWLAWNGRPLCDLVRHGRHAYLGGVLKELLGERSWLGSASPNLLNLVLAVVLFIPFICSSSPGGSSACPPRDIPGAGADGYPEGPLLSIHTPVGAAEYLQAEPGRPALQRDGLRQLPDLGASRAGRLRRPARRAVSLRALAGLYPHHRGTRYNELLDQYGADRLLLDVELQEELISILEETRPGAWNTPTPIPKSGPGRNDSLHLQECKDLIYAAICLSYPFRVHSSLIRDRFIA